MDLKQLGKTFARGMSKNSPIILTSIAVSGVIATTILAVKATPKAVTIVQQFRDGEKIHFPTKIEVIKLTWKCYIPAGVSAGITIGSIVALNSIHTRRTASLAAIYSITETAFTEYQNKVVNTIGKNKETAIRDEIAQDRIKKNPASVNEVFIAGRGEILCYDTMSGRYFKSDIDIIRRVVNDFNYRLMNEMYISLNEFYDDLGLAHTQLGDDLGWNIEAGKLELDYSTQLADNGTPCLVLNYKVKPKMVNGYVGW